MYKIGSDYDGTFSDHPEIWGEVDVVITGEGGEEGRKHVAKTWPGPKKPVFFNPNKRDLIGIVSHKARTIKRLNLEKFYENQKVQSELLKLLCPRTKIIHVKDNETTI